MGIKSYNKINVECDDLLKQANKKRVKLTGNDKVITKINISILFKNK